MTYVTYSIYGTDSSDKYKVKDLFEKYNGEEYGNYSDSDDFFLPAIYMVTNSSIQTIIFIYLTNI